MRELIPQRLWIGNAHDLRDVHRVLSNGIEAVIDLAMDESPVIYPRDIVYCRFPIVDGGGNSMMILRTVIQTAVDLVSDGRATLVACSAGMSRSPVIAAAALSVIRHVEPNDALAEICQSGPSDVSPNLWADIKALLVFQGVEGSIR